VAEPVEILIVYRGTGSIAGRAVAPPLAEVVRTVHVDYNVGDEIDRVRPGWYLYEKTIDRGVLRWVVERQPPGSWVVEGADPTGPDVTAE
jgi:hypothetical protein